MSSVLVPWSDEPPLVSIVLPTYNRRDLLLAAVESVRQQTCERWELLIADDGSTDGSVDALPVDRRIRVIRLAHTGNVARVRNAALDAATAGLVGFLDSDDRWCPRKLAAQITRLEHCPDAGWCYGRHGLIDERGNATPLRSGPAWVPREGSIVGAILAAQAGVAMQTVVVRRDVAAAIRFDERIPFADDHDFLVRLAFASPACVVDEIVAEVREHAGRTTHHRYDQTLGIAMRYGTYRHMAPDAALKRVCQRRRRSLVRSYLARARAAGTLPRGVAALIRAWIQQRP
jgi:glycosyltransferase involved in cell wall biosynthesis